MTPDEPIEECARAMFSPNVCQADREAAAAYWKSQGIGSAQGYREILAGKRDESSQTVQAFARHRLAVIATVRKVLSEPEMQAKLGNVGVGAIVLNSRAMSGTRSEQLAIALPAMLAASPLEEVEDG